MERKGLWSIGLRRAVVTFRRPLFVRRFLRRFACCAAPPSVADPKDQPSMTVKQRISPINSYSITSHGIKKDDKVNIGARVWTESSEDAEFVAIDMPPFDCEDVASVASATKDGPGCYNDEHMYISHSFGGKDRIEKTINDEDYEEKDENARDPLPGGTKVSRVEDAKDCNCDTGDVKLSTPQETNQIDHSEGHSPLSGAVSVSPMEENTDPSCSLGDQGDSTRYNKAVNCCADATSNQNKRNTSEHVDKTDDGGRTSQKEQQNEKSTVLMEEATAKEGEAAAYEDVDRAASDLSTCSSPLPVKGVTHRTGPYPHNVPITSGIMQPVYHAHGGSAKTADGAELVYTKDDRAFYVYWQPPPPPGSPPPPSNAEKEEGNESKHDVQHQSIPHDGSDALYNPPEVGHYGDEYYHPVNCQFHAPCQDYSMPYIDPPVLPPQHNMMDSTVTWGNAFPTLPTAYPVMPTAYPVMPTAYPVMPTAYPVMPTAYPVMPTTHPMTQHVAQLQGTHQQFSDCTNYLTDQAFIKTDSNAISSKKKKKTRRSRQRRRHHEIAPQATS